jgi:beta-1,4-mannosyltransferase
MFPMSILRGSSASKKRRILAWPREISVDPYYKRLSDGLESYGWEVDNFDYRRALWDSYGLIHIHQGTFPFRNRRRLIALPRVCIAASLIWLGKVRGARLVWSVHNLGSHEQYHPRLERAYLTWISRIVDFSIHMTESGRQAAFARFSALAARPSVVIPLMHFSETYGELPTRIQARQQLGLGEKLRVVLFLGQIRRYKNVPELIRVFRELSDNDLRLFIVGNPQDAALVQEIRNLASDPRITLSLKLAPVEDVKTFMAAASLVVAPYQEVLNSGSALLGLTHHRPVLLPNRGAMAELQSTVGEKWVRLYVPPLTPAILEAALEWAEETTETVPDLSHYSPHNIVKSHFVAFEKLQR